MSSLPDYDDRSFYYYGSVEYQKSVRRKRSLFEQSRESIKLAIKLEREDQQAAYVAYLAKRAKRQNSADKDIALYHNDKSIQVN